MFVDLYLAYYLWFTFRSIWNDLLFRGAFLECCVLTLIAVCRRDSFSRSPGYEKNPRVFNDVYGGNLFTNLFLVRQFANTIAIFKTISQCLLDASMELPAYPRSAEFNWRDRRCLHWLPYKCKNVNLLNIAQQILASKNPDCEVLLLLEIL